MFDWHMGSIPQGLGHIHLPDTQPRPSFLWILKEHNGITRLRHTAILALQIEAVSLSHPQIDATY